MFVLTSILQALGECALGITALAPSCERAREHVRRAREIGAKVGLPGASVRNIIQKNGIIRHANERVMTDAMRETMARLFADVGDGRS